MVETTEGLPSFDKLSKETCETLSQIPDYPLDFNIFIFKGIHDIRGKMKDELKEFRLSVEDDQLADSAEVTSTSQNQDRLLEILLIERHRRDIILLNEFINSQDSSKSITPIKLTNPMKYEIKSPIFKKLQASVKDYENSFKKFALLQNLEFKFEEEAMADDELVEEFVSDEIMNFNKTYLKPEDKSVEEAFENIFKEGKFIRVVIPLAAQGILMGVDIEKEISK